MVIPFEKYLISRNSFFSKHNNDYVVSNPSGLPDNFTLKFDFSDGTTFFEHYVKKELSRTVTIDKCRFKIKFEAYYIHAHFQSSPGFETYSQTYPSFNNF